MAQTSEFYTKEGVDTEVKKVADELAETKTTFNAKIENLQDELKSKAKYSNVNLWTVNDLLVNNITITRQKTAKIGNLYFTHVTFRVAEDIPAFTWIFNCNISFSHGRHWHAIAIYDTYGERVYSGAFASGNSSIRNNTKLIASTTTDDAYDFEFFFEDPNL